MQKLLFTLFITITSFQLTMAQNGSDNKTITSPTLRHVVMFKFVDKATPADVKKIEEAFRSLKTKISLIKDFEWGVNNSPENLNQGLTHCFFVTFSSAADRDAYLVHPAHKAFVELAGPQIEKATVLDYWMHR